MKTSSSPLVLFTALFILSGTLRVTAQTLVTGNDTIPKELPATVDRTKMLKLVNDVRAKGYQCGDTYYYPAAPLAWNMQLEQAAYNHTADMEKNKYFSHKAPDGSRGGARLDRVGYQWKTFGENIGEGYKTEKDMVNGWLTSPGHCKNIMSKNFTEIGVARVGNTWTQEFGSR